MERNAQGGGVEGIDSRGSHRQRRRRRMSRSRGRSPSDDDDEKDDGEGGTGKGRLSGRGESDNDDEWKRRLKIVANALGSLPVDGHVRFLYNAVKDQIVSAVYVLEKLDADADWAQIMRVLQESSLKFQLIGLGTTVDGHSLNRLFQALVSGLQVDESEWRRIGTDRGNGKKSEFLGKILGRIGKSLEGLNKNDFYERAVGKGSTVGIARIYSALQGGSTTGLDAHDDTQRDWRDRLRMIDRFMDGVAGSGTAMLGFELVREQMKVYIGKIIETDFQNSDNWGKLRSRLNEIRLFFYGLSFMGGARGRLFNMLYDGVKIDKTKWERVRNSKEQDEIMNSLLHCLGEKMDGFQDRDYELVFNKGGAKPIKSVARILMGEPLQRI